LVGLLEASVAILALSLRNQLRFNLICHIKAIRSFVSDQTHAKQILAQGEHDHKPFQKCFVAKTDTSGGN
jgi:hypothetical protein